MQVPFIFEYFHDQHDSYCEKDIVNVVNQKVTNWPKIFSFIYLQVATALLVAGSTLILWIPWQTLFASTRLYSSIVQSARLLI